MGEDFNFDAAPAAPSLSFGEESPAAAAVQEAPVEPQKEKDNGGTAFSRRTEAG